MNIELLNRPGSTVAKVTLEPGEKLTAEGGAMVAMSGNMDIETTTQSRGKGGLLGGLKRALAGESFFLNHFEANGGRPGDVLLSTSLAGDMEVIELRGQKVILEAGSFVAHSPGIGIDLGFTGFKSLFSGEGVFWLQAQGEGKLIISSFGSIFAIDVDGEYTVDTGHIVGFEESLDYSITKAGSSWLHSMIGGEGMVCKFKGKGRLWCQSHSATGFGRALTPGLRAR